MTAPATIWIDPSYLDSPSRALACNLGTADPARKLPGDVEYVRADIAVLVMSDPRVAALAQLLREARDDLRGYVDADYPLETRVKYPSVHARYLRDMALCYHIDDALAALKGEGE